MSIFKIILTAIVCLYFLYWGVKFIRAHEEKNMLDMVYAAVMALIFAIVLT